MSAPTKRRTAPGSLPPGVKRRARDAAGTSSRPVGAAGGAGAPSRDAEDEDALAAEEEEEDDYDDDDDDDDDNSDDDNDDGDDGGIGLDGAGISADEEPDDDEGGDGSAGGGDAPLLGGEVWRPGTALGAGEELECDMEAYVMYHKFAVDWPCLSFDPVPDRLGGGRADFPLTLTLVAGTQADSAASNTVNVLRFSALRKTQRAPRADGEEDDEEEEEDEEEEAEGGAASSGHGGGGGGGGLRGRPSVAAERAPHDGTVNRIRTMPQEPRVVATWSETGRVHLYDIRAQLRALDTRRAGTAAPAARHGGPVQTLTGHATEGYALAWSAAAPGRLASGDCAGRILVWDAEAKGLAGASARPCAAGREGSEAEQLQELTPPPSPSLSLVLPPPPFPPQPPPPPPLAAPASRSARSGSLVARAPSRPARRASRTLRGARTRRPSLRAAAWTARCASGTRARAAGAACCRRRRTRRTPTC